MSLEGGGGLLEWLAGCGPASLAIAIYQWKVQESSSCLFHDAGCLSSVYLNREEVGYNASEGIDLSARARAGRQAENGLKVDLLTSSYFRKKALTGIPGHLGFS